MSDPAPFFPFGSSPQIPWSVRVVKDAGSISVTKSDWYVGVNKTSGEATTVNLPVVTAFDKGLQLVIKDEKLDASSNNITITPASGNIVGTARASTYVMSSNGQATYLVYNGTEWVVI